MSLIMIFRAGLLISTLFASIAASATELKHWPATQAEQLTQLIKTHANQGDYAVFDMDSTTYQNDLEEALLPWLENRQLLTRQNIATSLQLIPFDDSAGQPESLYSYYHRLCAIDEMICYPWAAQVFSGFRLQELKSHIDTMLAEQKAIPVILIRNHRAIASEVHPPKMLAGMQELFAKLQENGIRVYIMSAAHEELVRMIASDPRYGYHVKPENVICVNTLLKNTESGELTTARKQIRAGHYQPEKNQQLLLTPYLVNPMTWYEGKAGSILAWIDQWRKPILVGGDTLYSDTFMLLNSTNVADAGLRLWVNRSEDTRNKLKILLKQVVIQQKAAGTVPDGDKNWVIVQQQQLQ